jgi:hypothetical protein
VGRVRPRVIIEWGSDGYLCRPGRYGEARITASQRRGRREWSEEIVGQRWASECALFMADRSKAPNTDVIRRPQPHPTEVHSATSTLYSRLTYTIVSY